MPEGDTVHKLAAYLAPELTGRKLVTGMARTTPAVSLADKRIERVYARGKHLFIVFDDHQLLRSHLGMWGSWHGYEPGESWQKPRSQASLGGSLKDP
jgi:endonuclease-8